VEGVLQAKLTRLSKLAAVLAQRRRAAGPNGAVSAQDLYIDDLQSEIEDLAIQFSELIESMGRCVANMENGSASTSSSSSSTSSSSSSSSTSSGDVAACRHQLHRFRMLDADFRLDFNKTKDKIVSCMARAMLLGEAQNTSGSLLRPRTELLLKERAALDSSLKEADDVIDRANFAQQRLQRSRQMFASINTNVASLGARFPEVARLIRSIQRHKQRDSIILAIFTAICMTFTFLFWWHRG